MQYLLTFLEGILSFVSPCMLPLLPLYVSYFAGDAGQKKHILPRAISFVAGFSLIFCLLGLFAGTLGTALHSHKTVVNLVCGALVILFGLSYLEVIPLRFLKGMASSRRADGIVPAFLFGVVYSVSLTPCVGAFLGSALLLAASAGGAWKGLSLLLVYSLGLGIPFVLSALLLDRLGGAFAFLKRHYKVINKICGVFLILVGACMALGWLDSLLALFS